MATTKKAAKKAAPKKAAKAATAVKRKGILAASKGPVLAFAIGERVRVPYRFTGSTEKEAVEKLLAGSPEGGYCLPHGYTVRLESGETKHYDF